MVLVFAWVSLCRFFEKLSGSRLPLQTSHNAVCPLIGDISLLSCYFTNIEGDLNWLILLISAHTCSLQSWSISASPSSVSPHDLHHLLWQVLLEEAWRYTFAFPTMPLLGLSPLRSIPWLHFSLLHLPTAHPASPQVSWIPGGLHQWGESLEGSADSKEVARVFLSPLAVYSEGPVRPSVWLLLDRSSKVPDCAGQWILWNLLLHGAVWMLNPARRSVCSMLMPCGDAVGVEKQVHMRSLGHW
jgi:hypothetical protein